MTANVRDLKLFRDAGPQKARLRCS